MALEIFPAIDIRGGRVVRLTQGDYAREAVYADDPLQTALGFRAAGAENLHMVDLDGARDGAPAHAELIRRVVEHSGLAVQVGGGLRDEAAVRRMIDIGVARVILGTAALRDGAFLSRMVDAFGAKIAVGVDAKAGRVAVNGWTRLSEVEALGFCRTLERAGVATVIYTDIARDGMGEGCNLEATRALCAETRLRVVASGGISRLSELAELAAMGAAGAVLGKALYTGALNLKEVLASC